MKNLDLMRVTHIDDADGTETVTEEDQSDDAFNEQSNEIMNRAFFRLWKEGFLYVMFKGYSQVLTSFFVSRSDTIGTTMNE